MRRLLIWRRPSTGTVLGSLALFIALGGTALAATGQLVHLVDPVTAGNAARVDSAGALKTSQSNLPTPARSFTLAASAGNNYQTSSPGFLSSAASTATVALTRVLLSPTEFHTATNDVVLYYATVAPGQGCSSASSFADYRELGEYAVRPGETVVDALSVPIVLKPVGSRAWCLLVYNYASPTSDGRAINVNASGWVVSGTPPPGTALRARPNGTFDPRAGQR